MRYRSFQGSSISALGLGTLTWGRDTDDFEAREQIEVFIEAGGTFFDTSENFHPNSLRILHEGLRQRPRSSFQISLHIQAYEGRRDFIERFSTIYESISLERIDYLVIEPLLEFDYWASIASEIQSLYEHKLIDGFLFRNVPAWKSVRLQSYLPAHMYAGEHFNYSLLESGTQQQIDQATNLNRKIIATAALASGVLTGKYRSTIPADSRAASPHLHEMTKKYFTPTNLAIVEATEKAASGLGVSTSAIALAWLQQQDYVASAVIGPRSAAQLRAVLTDSDFELPAAIVAALDDVVAMHHA